MFKKILLAMIALMITSCRPTPFKVGVLRETQPTKIEAADQRLAKDLEGVLNEGMAARYKKVGRPSFGIIKGYYRLPTSKPFGAASVVRGYSYETYFESVEIRERDQAYAIEPIPGDDADALHRSLNSLLAAGVRIKEVGMADALTIAKAEKKASDSGDIFRAKKVLSPDVDYLISIYPSRSARGPILIGRVIKSDGTLMAFRVVDLVADRPRTGALLITLFEDTIARL